MKYFLTIILIIFSTLVYSQIKVLFIGNSLTAWHEQPYTFENMAINSGKDVFVLSRARPGLSLQDHCDSEVTIEQIYSEKWDYVIIQDSRYEIAFPEYHYVLDPQIDSLKSMIYDNCSATKIIFTLDYSMRDGVTALGKYYDYNDFQDILTEGTLQYINNELIIGPVGEAIRTSRNDNPDFELIEDDLVHPTVYGSYLTACVYYSTIFREECNGNSYYDDLNREDALYLQSVASNIVMNNLDKWNNGDYVDDYYPMDIEINTSDVSYYNGSDGIINLGVCGGKKPHLYKLDDGDYTSEHVFSNLNAGTYIINVKDALDSLKTFNVEINQPNDLTDIEFIKNNDIVVKPSVVNDWITINSKDGINIEYVEIYSITSGSKIKMTKTNSCELKINLVDINSGIYIIKVISNEKVSLKRILKL